MKSLKENLVIAFQTLMEIDPDFREIVDRFINDIIRIGSSLPSDPLVEARKRSKEDLDKKRRELRRR